MTSLRRISAPRTEAPTANTPQINARQTARRPSSGMTSGGGGALPFGLLRLVLRRAAGHDLLRGERAFPVPPFDHDLASLREHVGQNALVGDGYGLAAVLPRQLEGELVGPGIPAHRAGAHPALDPQVLAVVRRLAGDEFVHLEVVRGRAADPGIDEV